MTDTNGFLPPLHDFGSGIPIRPRLACLDNKGPGSPLLLLAVLPAQTAAFIKIDRTADNHPVEATILQKRRLNHHWAWRIIIKPEIYFSPYAVEKKLCVIPDIDDKMHVINGYKKSTIHDLDALVTSPLNIWNEIVVAGFADDVVRGISLENNHLGQVKFKLKGKVNAQPIIEELNGRPCIFFGTAAGKFYGYDLRHAIEQQHAAKPNGVQEKPELYYAGNCTLSACTVFKPTTQPKKRWLAFGCDNGRLHCIDAETGKTPSGPGIIMLPIDVGRFLNKENVKIRSAVKFIKHGSVEQPSYLVFYVDEAGGNTLEDKRFGRLCIVDLFKFADQARFYPPASKNAVGPLIGSPQITDKGRICLTTKNDFTVLELAPKSPFEIKLLKQCRIEDGVSSTPLIVDGTAYFGSESGRLYAISTEHGRSQ